MKSTGPENSSAAGSRIARAQAGAFARVKGTYLGLVPHSAAAFLITLALLFVTAPFIQELPRGEFVDAFLVSLVLCVAITAVGAGRRAMIAAIFLSLPALSTRWAILVWPGSLPSEVPAAAFFVFVAYIVVLFIRFILRAKVVNSEVLCSAVSVYLMLALLWTTAYLLVASAIPGSFSGLGSNRPLIPFEAIYFSVITLTTVGYGDIAPVSGPARMLAMTEAITGTLYVAVLMARLVSLYAVEVTVAARRVDEAMEAAASSTENSQ